MQCLFAVRVESRLVSETLHGNVCAARGAGVRLSSSLEQLRPGWRETREGEVTRVSYAGDATGSCGQNAGAGVCSVNRRRGGHSMSVAVERMCSWDVYSLKPATTSSRD